MDLLAAVSEPRVRDVLSAAARLGGWTLIPLDGLPAAGAYDAARWGTLVLVHDLLPRADRQMEELRVLAGDVPLLRVYLVLPVLPEVLRIAVRHGADLPLLGVDVAIPACTPGALAERMRAAMATVTPGLVVWERVQTWPLEAALRDLARVTLLGLHVHRRVAMLAREGGVRYERARQVARASGVGAPGAFAEALRLACAGVTLAAGARVYQAAADHGFRDADHLCARLRHRFGITPSQARGVGGAGMLDELEVRWFALPRV